MRLKLELNVFEAMVYFWTATLEREKVGERYLNDLAAMEGMGPLYDEGFSPESVRKILSAISNRELFRPESKKEGRFWNNNMWIMEDPEVMGKIVGTVKGLEAETICRGLPEAVEGEMEVVFVPGHLEAFYSRGRTLYVNLFLFRYDFNADGIVFMDGPVEEVLRSRILEIIRMEG